MQYENFIYEKKDNICIITINRPPANAWNLGAMEEFEKIIDELERDKEIRVAIITGAGEKSFSAGFDVKDAENAPKTSPKGRDLWMRIDKFPKPVIAAINGFALGGGLELAISCQFRIMADDPDIKIGLTELNLGIIPGWGGTQRLPRLIGGTKALDMILFSKTVGAKEALEIGLVNELAPPDKLMEYAIDFAKKLADRPPIALSCVLKAMAIGAYEGINKGLDVEAEGSEIVRNTKDRIEGFNAFLEKRAPVFTGE